MRLFNEYILLNVKGEVFGGTTTANNTLTYGDAPEVIADSSQSRKAAA